MKGFEICIRPCLSTKGSLGPLLVQGAKSFRNAVLGPGHISPSCTRGTWCKDAHLVHGLKC